MTHQALFKTIARFTLFAISIVAAPLTVRPSRRQPSAPSASTSLIPLKTGPGTRSFRTPLQAVDRTILVDMISFIHKTVTPSKSKRIFGRILLPIIALSLGSSAHGQTVRRLSAPPAVLQRMPSTIVGRFVAQADGSILRQWPGTYFDTSFIGPAALFRLGHGDISLRIVLDNNLPVVLVKPRSGLYSVSVLTEGTHHLRIDVISESQTGPTVFDGFFAPKGTITVPIARRPRDIEFIGDSHTVGYGNTSLGQVCDDKKVWETTDTSQGIAPLIAGHYDADYEVNAISGRGVVRNYNGFIADTLPQAYMYQLFDKQQPLQEHGWHPQIIVISLGTNDFSTPLRLDEKWKTSISLRLDFERSYTAFIQNLRFRNPGAYIVVWATDHGGNEIETEVSRVVDELHRYGANRVGFVPVNGLAFSSCNAHPSLVDDQEIAAAIEAFIDRQHDLLPAQ